MRGREGGGLEVGDGEVVDDVVDWWVDDDVVVVVVVDDDGP